jgi:uncharacterized protein (PEP-CTERM system associated)
LPAVRLRRAFACAGLFLACSADAQSWTFTPGVKVLVTASDNIRLATDEAAERDVLVELTPAFTLIGNGKRFKALGSFEFPAVHYVERTERDRILPRGSLTGTLEAVEKMLFVDAGIVSAQYSNDPLGPRQDGPGTLNTVTNTQYRISPYSTYRFGGEGTEARWRSDFTWMHTTDISPELRQAYVGKHNLAFEHAPRPFGMLLSYDRTDTRFDQEGSVRLTDEIARLALNLGVTQQLSFGAAAGIERASYLIAAENDRTFAGAQLRWQPTERTLLNARWDDRFFGSGWLGVFTHRMPWLAWNIQSSRDVTTFPQQLLTLPAGSNVAAVLDALLTTRYPDPILRAQAVQEIIAQQRLPAALSGATPLYTNGVNLVTTLNGTVTLLGVRSALALNVYRTRTENAPGVLASLIGVPTVLNSNEQRGGSVTLNRRLSPLTAASMTVLRQRIVTLPPLAPETTTQHTLRLQLNRQLSPRTDAVLGLRFQDVEATNGNNARENAVYAGFGHRL